MRTKRKLVIECSPAPGPQKLQKNKHINKILSLQSSTSAHLSVMWSKPDMYYVIALNFPLNLHKLAMVIQAFQNVKTYISLQWINTNFLDIVSWTASRIHRRSWQSANFRQASCFRRTVSPLSCFSFKR